MCVVAPIKEECILTEGVVVVVDDGGNGLFKVLCTICLEASDAGIFGYLGGPPDRPEFLLDAAALEADADDNGNFGGFLILCCVGTLGGIFFFVAEISIALDSFNVGLGDGGRWH